METINNVVSSASKAIWGEQNTAASNNETAGKEPVSGMQGKGTAEEPYDQGNAENPTEPAGKSNVSKPTPATFSDPTTITANNPATTQTTMNPNSVAASGVPKPLEDTAGTGVTGASAQKYEPKGGDVIPSETSNNSGAVPASGAAPSQKQQGADRPKDAPAGEAVSAVTSSKDDAEEALNKRYPNDLSGVPMPMHGGSEKIPETQAERRVSKAGMPGGQEHGKPPKGTGEQWVKSTGLQADGGDFDATKPGAGKEADRILEQKGVHKDDSGAMEKPAEPSGGAEKDKVSKMDKLKDKFNDKLHIGHKDK